VLDNEPMQVAFVLVHSPLVGPLTWAPVAARLVATGAVGVVPSLLGVTDGPPPFWPPIARRVTDAVAVHAPAGMPVILVAHSNAGYFIPSIVEAIARAGTHPVAGCVFVDAGLPARTGTTPVVPPGMVQALRAKATDGRLPPWSTWWEPSDVERMFPDAATQRAVSAEQPRLPLAYYEQRVPVPPGWDSMPCGYVWFSPHYEAAAREARARGWAVEHIAGLHLHQLVDPDAVTTHLVRLGDRFGSG
jgi:hypothetical protein